MGRQCRCGHDNKKHWKLRGRCLFPRCQCSRYRLYSKGQTLAEYALILLCIAAASIGAYLALSHSIDNAAKTIQPSTVQHGGMIGA